MLITQEELETLQLGAEVYVGTGMHAAQTPAAGLYRVVDIDFDHNRIVLRPKCDCGNNLLLGYVHHDDVVPGWYTLQPDPMTKAMSFNPRSTSLLVELR